MLPHIFINMITFKNLQSTSMYIVLGKLFFLFYCKLLILQNLYSHNVSQLYLTYVYFFPVHMYKTPIKYY